MLENLIKYKHNTANFDEIHQHLNSCDQNFFPKLSSKVNIAEYSEKINNFAEKFEAWQNEMLIGLVAVYKNDENHFLFITNVSLLKEFQGKGIAKQLIMNAIDFAKDHQYKNIKLEVHLENENAIQLYTKLNFKNITTENESAFLTLNIN